MVFIDNVDTYGGLRLSLGSYSPELEWNGDVWLWLDIKIPDMNIMLSLNELKDAKSIELAILHLKSVKLSTVSGFSGEAGNP